MRKLALLAALLAALVPGAVSAQTAEHHHGHGAPGKLQLDHGRRWPTDESLRQGMAAIRDALAERLPAIRKGSLPGAEYAPLGRLIEARLGDILRQCKLAPQADAMLHLVVAELAAAAEALQNPAGGQPAAARRAVRAVNAYGRYFDHPGWQPLR